MINPARSKFCSIPFNSIQRSIQCHPGNKQTKYVLYIFFTIFTVIKNSSSKVQRTFLDVVHARLRCLERSSVLFFSRCPPGRVRRACCVSIKPRPAPSPPWSNLHSFFTWTQHGVACHTHAHMLRHFRTLPAVLVWRLGVFQRSASKAEWRRATFVQFVCITCLHRHFIVQSDVESWVP